MTELGKSSATITAVIIAKDEELMLPGCLKCLEWCDEVLVIDNGSKDQTASIADQFGAQVVSFQYSSFAKLRTEALKRIKTAWIVYVDADERVTPALAREILVHLETAGKMTSLALKRTNVFYGQILTAGGWEKDVLPRVFRLENLTGWQGVIHETPEFKGELVELQQPLIHFSHRNTTDGLIKTTTWTQFEAKLLFEAGLAPVKILTILRKGLAEFLRRGVFWHGAKDGEVGWIEAIIQGINKMLIYVQVWELQRKPSLTQTYESLDNQTQAIWENQTDLLKKK